MKKLLVITTFLLTLISCRENRIDSILSSMTLEEKAGLLVGDA